MQAFTTKVLQVNDTPTDNNGFGFSGRVHQHTSNDEANRSKKPSWKSAPVSLPSIRLVSRTHDDKLQRHNQRKPIGRLFWIILMDAPLVCLFGAYMLTCGLKKFGEDYLMLQISLLRWTPDRSQREVTYYPRVCQPSDQTTNTTTDLLITPNMTADDALQVMLTHGAVILPKLLSPKTANELREFILEENKMGKDMIWVIKNENRWSFYTRVDQHPTVTKALQEALNQPQLVEALELIAGKNPAVIEFTSITSAYGAKAQHWHKDVVSETNAIVYGRRYIPSYSLFIPLQNTTAAMGATAICPGSHMCADSEFCKQTGFQVSGADNNWPVGYGALVNQQTTHMGTAYTDPNGPHRVVFILTFAPRPRFGDHQQLETRTIGGGGSYSLHWTQWGHTLYDFQDPTRNMQQPWRTLRSMGLYKPRNQQWGWDFVTQACSRIATTDVGYTSNDLDDYIEKGGIPFLPRWLQGTNPVDKEGGEAWIDFAKGTITLVQKRLYLVHIAALIVYLTVGLCSTFIVVGRRRRWAMTSIILRAVVLHGMVLGACWLELRRASSQPWTKNLLSKRLYSSVRHGVGPHEPNRPASLPLVQDVLLFDHMRSSYMESFANILDSFHAGTKKWNEMIARSYSNYEGLSSSLQSDLVSFMLKWTRAEQRRFMARNFDGSWGEVEPEYARWIIHKALMTSSNSFLKEATRQIDFLLTETVFGCWRDTVLHQIHIPRLLHSLEDKLLKAPMKAPSIKRSQNVYDLSQGFMPKIHLAALRPKATFVSFMNRRSHLVSLAPVPEPFPGAWLQVGDVVEAAYNGDTNEWYRGHITFANAEHYTWNVEYDDGDEDLGLCRECVRPFVHYQVNDTIEARLDEQTYASGRITAVLPKDMYNLKLDDGTAMKLVPVGNLRRMGNKDTLTLDVGTEVASMLEEDDDEWYHGVIVKDNTDGTYDIQYEDGDHAERVPRSYIKVIGRQRFY